MITMLCPACNGTMRDTETIDGTTVVECVECLARIDLTPEQFDGQA